MGWCSATQIMDTALSAAEKAVTEAFRLLGAHPDPASLEEIGKKLDDVLRPFVAELARKLRAEDWDCEQDSVYFDRFPQEMLGYDDHEFARWLGEQLQDERDPARIRVIADQLERISQAVSDGS